jgi:predicted DNA-binding transcriptional regulator YafY
MTNFKYIERLQKLNYLIQLIEKEGTGTAEDLANRFGVSRRTIFRYIEELRLMGAEISYSHTRNSFIFEKNFDFHEKIS